MLVRQRVTVALLRIAPGWPSQVMMTKFKSLNNNAKQMVTELFETQKMFPEGDPERIVLQAAIEKIRRAGAQVTRGGGGRIGNALQGPFRADTFYTTLFTIFGDPILWHWLIPFVPGGSGDPLRPESCNVDACEAWAGLASAMDIGNAALAKAHKTSEEWSQRVREILSGSGSP